MREHTPFPQHMRSSLWESSSDKFPHKKRVRFLHLLPYWQKSETLVCVCAEPASLASSWTYHILLPWGFSKIHGTPTESHSLMTRRAAFKHLLPMAIFTASLSLTSGKPHGAAIVRMTAVRSRAGENVEQGGASITPSIFPARISEMICLHTAGLVRSQCFPNLNSHTREAKPRCLMAFATPPCPAKRSAK